MAGSGIQQRRTHAQRQALVAAYDASGLSQRAFCAQYEIAVSTLRHWREPPADAVAAAQSTPRQGARLIPVQVLGEEPSATSGVTLIADGGLRIEVATGFDGPTLARVVATLGAGT